jgi:MraZ protein
MFIGTFSHSLDDKGRLTLPARFREELAPGVVVTRGIDNCLFVYPRAVFEARAERIAQLPLAERNAQRHFFANASDDVPDKQGRVLIPAHLREYSGLESEAVITGLFDHLEIWHPARWAAFNAQGDSEALAERLRAYGI